jgi:hypothetical protein
MALYPYALFFHIIGVIGLFIAISLEVATGFRLRAAKTTAQVQEWMVINRVIEMVLPGSALLILVSGLFMLFTTWGWSHAWIDLSLGLLIVVGVLATVINGPRMKAIQMAVEEAPDGEISASLQKRISDPVMRAYTLIPGCMALGVVALMTLKLDWIGSGVVIIRALMVGIIGGAIVTRNGSQSVVRC